jgi:hypothetical protein
LSLQAQELLVQPRAVAGNFRQKQSVLSPFPRRRCGIPPKAANLLLLLSSVKLLKQ